MRNGGPQQRAEKAEVRLLLHSNASARPETKWHLPKNAPGPEVRLALLSNGPEVKYRHPSNAPEVTRFRFGDKKWYFGVTKGDLGTTNNALGARSDDFGGKK